MVVPANMRLTFSVHTILISLCVQSKKLNESKFEGKIVGGDPVKLERFPSAVQFYNLGSLCAGSILNSYTVLTAAHCFDANKELDEMMVQVGARYLYDHRAKNHKVDNVVVHEEYNKKLLFSCDIALMFLKKPIKFNNKTKKAVIVDTNKWMSRKQKHFAATGWGWTKYGGPVSEKGLMMTNLGYVPSKECGLLHNLTLTKDMFCLYGDGVRDTCRGDSGGGILWNNMVVGVTSHGDGCAKKNKPSVYCNVWFFRDWIKGQIAKFLEKFCENTENLNVKKSKIKS